MVTDVNEDCSLPSRRGVLVMSPRVGFKRLEHYQVSESRSWRSMQAMAQWTAVIRCIRCTRVPITFSGGVSVSMKLMLTLGDSRAGKSRPVSCHTGFNSSFRTSWRGVLDVVTHVGVGDVHSTCVCWRHLGTQGSLCMKLCCHSVIVRFSSHGFRQLSVSLVNEAA